MTIFEPLLESTLPESEKRLFRTEIGKFYYRRMFERQLFEFSEAEVERVYRKHFPTEERNDEHMLLAMDVEYLTAFRIQ